MIESIHQLVGEETLTRMVSAFYRRVKTDDLLARMYPADDWEGSEKRPVPVPAKEADYSKLAKPAKKVAKKVAKASPLKKSTTAQVWTIGLPYRSTKEELEAIPLAHREGSNWCCRAKMEGGAGEIASWYPTPTLALAHTVKRIGVNAKDAWVELKEDFTPKQFFLLMEKASSGINEHTAEHTLGMAD